MITRSIRNRSNWITNFSYAAPLRFSPLYYTLFTLYNIFNALKGTGFTDLPQFHIDLLYLLIRILIFVCMIIHFLTLRLKLSAYILCIFVLSCVTAATLVSGSWNMLLLLLFLLGGREARVSVMARCIIWSDLAVIAVTAFCYSRGIISSDVYMSGIGTVRNTLGFSHPNTLGMYILTICCAYAVLRFRKCKWYDFLLFIFAFYYCYYLIYSRTSAIAVALIIALALITTIDRRGKLDALLLFLGLITLVALCISSIWLMVYYDPSVSWMSKLNEFMSGRLDLAHYYYETYSVHLFGYDFSSMQEAYKDIYTNFICDNAYAHVILQYGVIVFALVMFGYVYILLQSLIKVQLNPLVFGLIIFSVVAFSESGGLFICNNFCLIALSAPLLGLRNNQALRTKNELSWQD